VPLALGGGLIVFILRDGYLRELGEGPNAVPVAVALGICGAVLAFIGFRRSKGGEHGHATAAAGALAFVLLASGGVIEVARSEGARLVDDYCAYDAGTQAELDGCRADVSADDVRALDTPAAVFAREKGPCGGDAGPFCDAAVEQRESSAD
jgi:hypothetical protein